MVSLPPFLKNKIMEKINRMKKFHEWLYGKVKNIHPMDSETYDLIIDKIQNRN